MCVSGLQGSWIVKQSVGKSACLVGEALDITYFSSDNYLEVNTLKLFFCITISQGAAYVVNFLFWNWISYWISENFLGNRSLQYR